MGQPASTSTSTEVLGGLVERVTFHNEENGFCVLRVKARGQHDLITVLGHAAVISAGEFVQASGAWQNDRTHGVQFRASFLKPMPATTEGIEKYLGSGMIRPPARAGPIRSELPTRCANGSSPSGRHRPPSLVTWQMTACRSSRLPGCSGIQRLGRSITPTKGGPVQRPDERESLLPRRRERSFPR